jgi:hypothetical protein
MRDLKRNQRAIHYANVVGTQPILDEYGNDTLEVRTVYGPPTLLHCNISANMGQEAVEVFGSQTEYSRTISLAGNKCPLVEGSRIWFMASPEGQFNYTVARVADSKNGFLIALREVTPLA